MKTALSLVGLLVALPWIGSDTPRERTNRAQEAWTQGRFEEARELLDAVLESRPDSPVAQRNAGSARVAAGETESALDPLRAATAAPETAAAAFYDLGNAHLETGDLEAAVEAYQEALLREPGHQDAKHNLEVALHRQQDQTPQPQQQDAGGEDRDEDRDEGDDSEQGESSPSGEEPADSQSPDREGDRDDESPPEEAEGEGETTGAREPDRSRPSRLPQFQDQEDMTAEEAAALLEAVENLEREQRREMIEAARAEVARRLPEGKDW